MIKTLPVKKAARPASKVKPRTPKSAVPKAARGSDRLAKKTSLRELSWMQFDTAVQSLARQVHHSFRPEVVVGVAHGGVFVGGVLASALQCEFYPVRISRRSRDKQVRRSPRMYGAMPDELKGRRVLIVDDVSASGDTFELAVDLARKAGAKETKTACLVSRKGGYSPDWSLFHTEEFMVFPWDYAQVAEDARFDVDPEKGER